MTEHKAKEGESSVDGFTSEQLVIVKCPCGWCGSITETIPPYLRCPNCLEPTPGPGKNLIKALFRV